MEYVKFVEKGKAIKNIEIIDLKLELQEMSEKYYVYNPFILGLIDEDVDKIKGQLISLRFDMENYDEKCVEETATKIHDLVKDLIQYYSVDKKDVEKVIKRFNIVLKYIGVQLKLND